jgi:hypothetical protein
VRYTETAWAEMFEPILRPNEAFFLRFSDHPFADLRRNFSYWCKKSSRKEELLECYPDVAPHRISYFPSSKTYAIRHDALFGHKLESETLYDAICDVFSVHPATWYKDPHRENFALFRGIEVASTVIENMNGENTFHTTQVLYRRKYIGL